MMRKTPRKARQDGMETREAILAAAGGMEGEASWRAAVREWADGKNAKNSQLSRRKRK